MMGVPWVFFSKRVETGRDILHSMLMDNWSPGYTQRELDEAQDRYALRFPPDLIALFLERRPALGYHWTTEDNRIRQMLRWPLETLLTGVEAGFWWPDWGARPDAMNERSEVVSAALMAAPQLIPLLGHRFIPETPNEAGNPVFSMCGFDTVYYGANLSEYFQNEFEGQYEVGMTRHVPFWSDFVERSEEAYAFYVATGTVRQSVENIQERFRRDAS